MSKCPTCEQGVPDPDEGLDAAEAHKIIKMRVNLLNAVNDRRAALLEAEGRLRAEAEELVRLHKVMDTWEIGLLKVALDERTKMEPP